MSTPRERIIAAAKSVRATSRESESESNPDQFRVVITGKGGVGKTTLTALLARSLARRDFTVLALDADPQMNLPFALGLEPREAEALIALSKNVDYVEEKTGARPGEGWGLFFRLNPDVTDVVERFGVVGPDDVRLLVMGSLTQPAVGCLCPENSLLASVVNALALREGEVILMDTQAGVEHFGRALAKGFHQAVVVADPTFNAIQVAGQTASLARQMGIPAVHLVVNRVRREDELAKAEARVAQGGFSSTFSSVQALPYEERCLQSEPSVSDLLELNESPFLSAVGALRENLVRTEKEVSSCVS
jgi:CO dehydrogenase maturation factor